MHVFVECVLVLAKVVYFCLESFVRVFIPVKPKDIRGQTVLITGGGRGIGRELAIKFSAQDAKIALWDMNKAALKETSDDLKIRGATVFTYEVDVTDIGAVKQAADAVRRDVGDVDILVNNAGILIGKDILGLEEKDIRNTIAVNTIAHFWTVKEFLPAMLAKGQGHIVTIASMASHLGSTLLTDYCASKFAAFGFTEALAEELRVHNKQSEIHTTAVCPMFVGTNLIENEEFTRRVGFKDRFGKLLEPHEVAEAVVDGVLRNQPHVYVPSSAAGIRFLSFLPTKAKHTMLDFIDCTFYLK